MAKSTKFVFSPLIQDHSLDGFTLIMPAISVGNIGQLGLDILLATLKAKRLTSCYHPSVVPLVGSNPLDVKSTELMTACDIYKPEKCSKSNVILMQIRSAIVRGKSNEFLDDLLSWCMNVGIAKVILLSSSSADERVDSQIRSSPLRYLENGKNGIRTELQNLNWIEMERKHNFPGRPTNRKEVGTSDSLFLPCSGYTKSLFLKCTNPEENYGNIEFVALLMFASEGDNSGDAIQLVSYLNNWIKLLPVGDEKTQEFRLQFPVSWNALFGNPPPKIIF